MLRTGLCDLLGIDTPIVLAPFGPWAQLELAAAVSNAGALGSLGTALRSPDELRAQWSLLRELTDRPFAINHTGRPFNDEAFTATLDFAPRVISFHMGVPAQLIARAHDHGILWMQTVGDAAAADAALTAGADVLIAQGGEAGGNAGSIATLVLVPWSSISPARYPSSPPAGSRTDAASPRPSHSAQKVSAWAPASSPPTR